VACLKGCNAAVDYNSLFDNILYLSSVNCTYPVPADVKKALYVSCGSLIITETHLCNDSKSHVSFREWTTIDYIMSVYPPLDDLLVQLAERNKELVSKLAIKVCPPNFFTMDAPLTK
jgi:hypothetical protein